MIAQVAIAASRFLHQMAGTRCTAANQHIVRPWCSTSSIWSPSTAIRPVRAPKPPTTPTSVALP